MHQVCRHWPRVRGTSHCCPHGCPLAFLCRGAHSGAVKIGSWDENHLGKAVHAVPFQAVSQHCSSSRGAQQTAHKRCTLPISHE